MSARELIVNADDFGRSSGTNAGIVKAHEQGIVTSASLMVRWPAAEAAAEYARSRRQLSIGLHVDLSEWTHRDGERVLVYEHAPVAHEVPRQVDLFRSLVGRDPTHLDSHHHVHHEEPGASAVRAVAERLAVPLRGAGPIDYCGSFYGQSGKGESYPQAIEPEALITLIQQLPPGVTELSCHPGLDLDLDSGYRVERPREVTTLCHPRVRAALEREQVILRPF
jgi:predicted glycoside hydrolase/deacetylase ChbG (UPF0249 family)